MKISIAKKVLLLYVSFCFIALTSIAQTPKDTLAAFIHFKKADSLLTIKNYKESIVLFKKALPIYEQTKSWVRVAQCYNKLAKLHRYNKELDLSLKNIEKATSIIKINFLKNSKQEANTLHNKGNYYYVLGKYDQAIIYFNKALLIREKKDLPECAQSYNSLGAILNIKADYKTAISYFEKSLEINNYYKKHTALANNYNNIGTIYVRLKKLHVALEYFKKSLDIRKKHNNNPLKIGRLYTNIGITLIQLNKLDEALSYFTKAISLLNNHETKGETAGCYENIGLVYYEKGEYEKSMLYLKKSLNIKLKNYNESHPWLIPAYSNIANSYKYMGDFKRAMLFNKKALDIGIQSFGNNHPTLANIYSEMSELFISKKEYDNALKYSQKALDIALTIFDENNPTIATYYACIANVYYNKNMLDKALLYQQKGLAIMQNEYGDNHHFLSNFLFKKGEIHAKLKEYKTAMSLLDKALALNTKKINNNDSYSVNNHYNSQLLLKITHGKSQMLKTQYTLTDSLKYISKNILLHKESDKIIDFLRLEFQNYQDKLKLAKQAKNIYTDALNTQLLVYNRSKDKKALVSAWYYSEKSKANVLSELLENSNVKKFTNLPSKLLLLEKELKSNKAYYKSQIVNELSKDSISQFTIKEYKNKLFDISLKQDSLTLVLEKEYPKYFQLKHNKTPISIKEIQNKINEQTSLLEFFTTDSITYVFTITKNTLSVKQLALTGLSEKVADLNSSITTENSEAYKKIAHSLYKELLLPIKNNIVGDELIIIPDGPLWHLNFDLLLTQESTQQNTRDLPYLLRDYAISYGNSAHLLFNTTENNSKTSDKRQECLAFSFSDTIAALETKTMRLATLRDAGDDLPGTRKEIRAIADIIDGQYYYGSEANEKAFKQNAGQYSILHLALHGEVDNETPQNSKLLFTKSKDSIEDNLLYSHELFALNIPADLVVLSACNSGTGKVANGEGLMSLGNAFQYAGAKSLLLSKWEVSDKTTPDLMKYFYTNLKEGMNKAKALQQAKLKYLNTTETFYTHPFYWGSFYILGNTDAIPMYSGFNYAYLCSFGLLLGLLGLVVFIRSRKAA